MTMNSPHIVTLFRRQVLVLLALGISSVLGLLAACSGGSSSAPTATSPSAAGKIPPIIRIGFQPPYIPVFVMKDQKLLEKNFGDSVPAIEYRLFLSLNPIAEAVSGGSLDLGIGGTPVAALAAGQPIRILALTERSPKTHAILVRPDSPIKGVADLKGKKLGTPSGRAYVFPQRVLQRANIKDSEVNWVKLENNEGRSALLTGAIDAWATWDPFYANAEVNKEAVALVDGETYHTNYVVLFGNADFVNAYPEVVARFIQAYQQALAWVQANHSNAVQLFAKENKVSPEVAELTMSRRSYLLSPPDVDEYITDITDQGKFFVQIGVTQKEPDWKTVIMPQIAKSVLVRNDRNDSNSPAPRP